MEIIIRELVDSDKEDCLQIEAKALPGVSYVNDVWEDFTSRKRGYFLGAALDGRLVGIGKITKLYNGYGWLETLRVHPDYQGIGIGKAIYTEYMEKIKQMNFHAVGMYTESWNERSAYLANKFGLSFKARFTEFVKEIKPLNSLDSLGFKKVSMEESEDLLSPYYPMMGDFIVINRTYYPVKPGLSKHLAKVGWLFSDDEGNILVIGYRFQPQKALHLAFFYGDTEKIIKFAETYANKLKSSKISAMREYQDNKQHQLLKDFNFNYTKEEFITLWNYTQL